MLVVPNPPAPNSPPEVPPEPKAGLLAVLPNRPPPVLAAPKGEDVLVGLAVDPKPPNPVDEPAVAVLLPKSPPPLVVVGCPNGFVPPNNDCWPD